MSDFIKNSSSGNQIFIISIAMPSIVSFNTHSKDVFDPSQTSRMMPFAKIDKMLLVVNYFRKSSILDI